MPTTLESVRRALQQEEINYPELAHELGPAAIPCLQTIVSGDDVLLASKAAYVAGLIQDPASAALVAGAAKSGSPAVRVAAAATSQHLAAADAEDVLLSLLDDGDVGVRKHALRSVPHGASRKLKDKVA